MSLFLDPSKDVIVKFTFTNPDRVPLSLRAFEDESLEEKVVRKMLVWGQCMVGPIQKVEVDGVLKVLERHGWRMVGGRIQKRLGKQLPPRPYFDVKFRFQQTEEQCPDMWMSAFDSLAAQAYWQVRLFDNGPSGLSVNFDGCCPKEEAPKGFVPPRLVCVNHQLDVLIDNLVAPT